MTDDPPKLTAAALRPPLGAAWIAWAFLLCLGGIVSVMAIQRGPIDSTLGDLVRIAFWTRGAAVLMLAGMALGAGLIGRTLRRDRQVARWQVAALGFGAVAAMMAGGLALVRGVASRWLLVGDDMLATTLLVGGVGTLLLAGLSSWLDGIDLQVWPGVGEPLADGDETANDDDEAAKEELALLRRIAGLTLAGYLALSLLLTVSVVWLELASP